MKSLKESILANVETGLKNADKELKELTSFGGKLELEQIYGMPEVAAWGISIGIKNNINGLKPYSKTLDKVLADYTKYYGESDYMTQEKVLNNRTKAGLERFITYLENVKLNDTKIDFDDVKTKKEFVADLNTMMHNDGSIDSKTEITWDTAGDRKGMFRILLTYKYNRLTFVYKIK